MPATQAQTQTTTSQTQPGTILSSQFGRENNPFRRNRRSLQTVNPTPRKRIATNLNGPIANVILPPASKHNRHELEVGANKEAHRLFGSVDLQKKAIVDLWQILKRHGKLDLPLWSNSTPTWKVLEHVLLEVDSIKNGYDYTIQYSEKENLFFITYIHEYHLTYEHHQFDIDWLMNTYHENKPLHDLMIHLIGLLQSECLVPGLNDNDWFLERLTEWHEESLYGDCDEEEYQDMKNYIDLLNLHYLKGDPARYLRMLNSKNITIESFKSIVKSFKPQNTHEENLFEWTKRGFSLIESGHKLTDFIPDNYEELTKDRYSDDPNPDCSFKILWSSEDDFADEFERDLQGRYECNGLIAPLIHGHNVFPNHNTLPPVDVPRWPYDLADFFNDWWSLSQNNPIVNPKLLEQDTEKKKNGKAI